MANDTHTSRFEKLKVKLFDGISSRVRGLLTSEKQFPYFETNWQRTLIVVVDIVFVIYASIMMNLTESNNFVWVCVSKLTHGASVGCMLDFKKIESTIRFLSWTFGVKIVSAGATVVYFSIVDNTFRASKLIFGSCMFTVEMFVMVIVMSKVLEKYKDSAPAPALVSQAPVSQAELETDV